MSEVQTATPEELEKIDELVASMLKAVHGESGSLVATAALRIVIGLWKIGGADRFHAETVFARHMDLVFGEASKPN